MNILRRKLSFFKTGSNSTLMNSNYRHSHYEIEKKHHETNESSESSRQMPRSVTDSKGFKSNLSNASTMTNNTLTNIEAQTREHTNEPYDDVAHIFNRDSLNDCLNPKRSFKDCGNSMVKNDFFHTRNFAEPIQPTDHMSGQQLKRPSCLSLNYFKKETSI